MKDRKTLTIDEKISLLTGATAWTTREIEEIGLKSIKMTDGANGVRNENIKASCFPSPVAVASSFDVDVAYELGQTLADECKYFGTNLLLAPSMNIKRSPLCGRNSGYYSEDPIVTGEIAAAFVNGLQSQGVGGCLKHFAVYNQETERMTSDAIVDEQTLHEIYLKGFEIAVQKSNPASVMTSYNRSNGVYACENKYYLTDILRKKWGFGGIVISDWGGVNDRVEALKAGLDLEMPISGYGVRKIKKAYEEGSLTEEDIDKSFNRICDCVNKYANTKTDCYDFEKSKKTALDVAKKSIVLLKNQDKILPLKQKIKSVAVVGEGAVNPRVQSGGCDHTNLLWHTDFIAELQKLMPKTQISYKQGYRLQDNESDINLEKEAITACEDKEAVIFFLSLPERYESEGYDRQDLNIPENQIRLLEKITEINSNTVVIVQNGAPIDLRRVTVAKAILETYLLGGIAGQAIAEVLVGMANPSGKLAETFPLRTEDTPCYLNFPGYNDKTVYSEGLFVGYRYYSSKNIKVLYPFGYGLSYTEFKFDGFNISGKEISPNGKIDLSFTVSNVGEYDGAETVQVYVWNKNSGKTRPVKELKKFTKLFVKKGQGVNCKIEILPSDLSYYCVNSKGFEIENGDYEIMIGTSSEDIIKSYSVQAVGFDRKRIFDNHTRIGEILKTDFGRKVVNEKLLGYVYMAMFGNFNTDIKLGDDITKEPFFVNVMNNMPLQALCNFSFGEFDDGKLNEVLDLLNANG